MAEDKTWKSFDYPLNGRLITKLDGALLPEGHFQTLQNFRYNDGGIEPIAGMTKINASAFSYLKVVNGFHFRKEIPNTENYIFAQTTTGSNSRIVKSDNTAAIPAQDTFSTFVTLPTNNYVNFTEAPDQSMIMCDGYTNYVYSGTEYRVAKVINYDPSGTFYYDYTDLANNNLTDANNVFSLIDVTGVSYVYIGSTRPLSGVKFYVSTANASAATVAVKYWDGSTFADCTNVVDGTTIGGKTLNTTGTISFDSTVATSKLKAIRDNVAFYYSFEFTGLNAATRISQISLSAPVQGLVDVWDGVGRQIYSFINQIAFHTSTGYGGDETSKVYKLDYNNDELWGDGSGQPSFANIGGMLTTDYVYAGFNERLMGMKFYFGGTNVNTNAAVLDISYWDGTQWVDVGTVDDFTSVGGKSFAQSGTVTWNAPDAKDEYTTSVYNSSQWYYYRIHFDRTLSGALASNTTVKIDNIIGIPAQVNLHPYRFAVLWQNRLWLLNDQAKDKNTAVGSSFGTVCVFNGTDSGKLTFGGTQEVICAAPLFTRYGGSIYENLIVCKRNQTYLVDGTSPENYIVYEIAKTVGCIAPQTMKVCDTGYEVAPGLTKHVVVWLSATGVVMFDANSIINISSDIADRFDPTSDNYINESVASQFTAFYDAKRTSYHIQIATGTSTTLNEEWAYDLTRRKWYQVVRGAKYLTCGFEVEDLTGNKYVYGGTADGFLERLEYGNTFDGVSITYKFRLPDGLLDKSLMYVKEIRRIKLTGRCNSAAATVTVRHYADGSTTASSPTIEAISQSVSGKRIYQAMRGMSVRAVLHSFEFEATTNDSETGFCPLYVSGFYRVIRENLE